MARIGILTCSNCIQEANCAAVVCLGDMRKRRGFFERYKNEEKLDLIGIINCAGCPTLAAPEKIIKRVKALAEYRLDALHFAFCMVALCPFLKKFQAVINDTYPELEIVLGTHIPKDKKQFRKNVKELLCPTVCEIQDMNNIIRGTLKKKNGQS
ncbi:MAG: CGGC domain-containing protein [Deltaproteobacteria bacterium]|jgi:predicted metal-binding protein|nr:CGGC domain-containing protein [Deltaproteobacteria bacterium]